MTHAKMSGTQWVLRKYEAKALGGGVLELLGSGVWEKGRREDLRRHEEQSSWVPRQGPPRGQDGASEVAAPLEPTPGCLYTPAPHPNLLLQPSINTHTPGQEPQESAQPWVQGAEEPHGGGRDSASRAAAQGPQGKWGWKVRKWGKGAGAAWSRWRPRGVACLLSLTSSHVPSSLIHATLVPLFLSFFSVSSFFFFFFFFFCLFAFLSFLGLLPRHMEVPRLGV